MPRKGELSKTARASLANREELNHMTSRICEKNCNLWRCLVKGWSSTTSLITACS